MPYSLPAGIAAFGGGLASGQGGAFNNVLGSVMQSGGAGDDDDSYNKVLQVLELEQSLSSARQKQRLAQQQRQAEEAYVQSQPEELRALAGYAPDILARQQAEAHFSSLLTRDQQVDNELEERKFRFERQKYDSEQKIRQAELARSRGRLDNVGAKFYIGEVGKADKAYAESDQRYQSGIKSLNSDTATGDKAALVHMARLISDEALQEADVARNVSRGVMPSYFENFYNSVAGKGKLTTEQRQEMKAQFNRELAAKYGAYSDTFDRLGSSFSPEIIETERRRVLGEKRQLPKAAAAQAAAEARAQAAAVQQQAAAQQAAAQRQANAQQFEGIDPGQINYQMAQQMTDEQIDALPDDVLQRLIAEGMALEQQAAGAAGGQVAPPAAYPPQVISPHFSGVGR